MKARSSDRSGPAGRSIVEAPADIRGASTGRDEPKQGGRTEAVTIRESDIERFFEIITNGDRVGARTAVNRLHADGVPPEDIVLELFWPTMEMVEKLITTLPPPRIGSTRTRPASWARSAC